MNDFLGTELVTAISSIPDADLGLNFGGDSTLGNKLKTNPESLLCALLVKAREFLSTTPNPTDYSMSFSNNWSKTLGTGSRAGQLGYQITIQFWQTDNSVSTPSPQELA